MKKTILAALLAALLPLAALAQTGPGTVGGMAQGGDGMRGHGHGPGMHDPKRAKLALTLGLAEVLELDDAQALKLRSVIDQFETKRRPLQDQQREAMKVIRGAAEGEQAEAAAVDQALTKILDTRAQLLSLDRELVQGIVKDLPPQKKARALIFLARFHQRMMAKGPAGRLPGRPGGPRAGPGPGPGARGPWGEAEEPMPPQGMGGDEETLAADDE
jgi:Spy/CpxP family protein refolding chaperone